MMTGWLRTGMMALVLLGTAAAASALEIRFRPEAQVEGEHVTLGEVAEVTPADGFGRALALQTLDRAPSPGETMALSASKIRAELVAADPDLAKARWTGAGQIVVKRAGIEIDGERIENFIADYLRGKRAFLPRATVRFKPAALPRPFVLPLGKLACEVIPSDPKILSSRRFTLIFRVDGRVVRNLSVAGEIEAIGEVAVATFELRRGTILSAADIRLAPVDLTGLRTPCFEIDELIGKKLKRTLRVGDVIDRSLVEFPPMVKRGELVTISARRGPLQITATGVARGNGEEGEVIKVRNSNSQREILSRVVAPGVVEVEF